MGEEDPSTVIRAFALIYWGISDPSGGLQPIHLTKETKEAKHKKADIVNVL